MWKCLSLAAVTSLMATSALAATYHLEPSHSSAAFVYPHFGLSHPGGKIIGATGTLIFDQNAPDKSQVDATLDLRTLTTGLPDFDTQLKGPDYFDVAQYPTATFHSTGVTVTGDRTANVTGDLTVHGITQSVVLNVTFNARAFNPALFKTGVGFSATTKLSRKAFALDKLEPFVGDDIDLTLEAEAY